MAATKKDSKKTEGREIFCDHKKPRYFIKKVQRKWLETEAQAKSKQIKGLQMTSYAFVWLFASS